MKSTAWTCARSPLQLNAPARRNERVVFEGTLTCTNPHCGITYPIIDGIPILVADLPKYLNDALYAITVRDDLCALSETILGEAAGPGAVFNNNRHYLGTYGWDHYGDLAPARRDAATPRHWQPGSVVSCLATGLSLFSHGIEAPVLDVGCAAGRSALELAARCRGIRPYRTGRFLGVRCAGTALSLWRVRIRQCVERFGPSERTAAIVELHEREFARERQSVAGNTGAPSLARAGSQPAHGGVRHTYFGV